VRVSRLFVGLRGENRLIWLVNLDVSAVGGYRLWLYIVEQCSPDEADVPLLLSIAISNDPVVPLLLSIAIADDTSVPPRLSIAIADDTSVPLRLSIAILRER